MGTLLSDVCDVEVLGHYRLRLTFSDGLVGDVDLSHLAEWEGVFTPPSRSRILCAGPSGSRDRHDYLARRGGPCTRSPLRAGRRTSHPTATARRIILAEIFTAFAPGIKRLCDLALEQTELQRRVGRVEALAGLVLPGQPLPGPDIHCFLPLQRPRHRQGRAVR